VRLFIKVISFLTLHSEADLTQQCLQKHIVTNVQFSDLVRMDEEPDVNVGELMQELKEIKSTGQRPVDQQAVQVGKMLYRLTIIINTY